MSTGKRASGTPHSSARSYMSLATSGILKMRTPGCRTSREIRRFIGRLAAPIASVRVRLAPARQCVR